MGKYRSHSHLASSEPLPNTAESLSSAAAQRGALLLPLQAVVVLTLLRVMEVASQVGTWPKARKRNCRTRPCSLPTGPRVQKTWLLFVSVIKSLSEFCRALNQLHKLHQATPPGKGAEDGEVQTSRHTVERQVCLLKRPLHWKCYDVINFVLAVKSNQYNGPGRCPSKWRVLKPVVPKLRCTWEPLGGFKNPDAQFVPHTNQNV